jgi:hypothetical protein
MIRRTFRTLALLLAVAAVASVAASATTGHGNPLRSSLKVNLDIYDAHLSQKCDITGAMIPVDGGAIRSI